MRSAAVEKVRAELQEKANALRKLQRDLKTEQAEIARLKKLNIKLSDDIKKSKNVIANKDKAIKTLEAKVGGNLKKADLHQKYLITCWCSVVVAFDPPRK